MTTLQSHQGLQTGTVPPEWLAGPSRATTRYGERPLFKEGLYRVAEGCYAWMVPNGSWGETNIGLVDCGGKSVLIDTCWDLRYTQEMLDAAADLLARSPVECVINTHSDGDHCWGNQLFPGREIIATQACAHQMHHMKPQSLTALKAGARLAARLPFAGAQRFGHYMGAMFSPYDFRGIRITAPTSGFCGERQLRLNGVDLIVREVGPAHTDGDAYVYLPDRQVAYAGDILFVGVTPVMWAGPVENLLAGLKQLRALDARVIVPGHGPLATRADVQNVIDYWEFIQEELDRRRQQGMAPDQAARDLALSPRFQAMPFAQWDSPERIVTNAYTLYRHWGADTGALPGNLGIMDVLRRQAALAFALPQATPRAMRSRVPLRH